MTSLAPAPVPLQLLDAMLRMAPLDVLLFDVELVCRYAVLADETLFGRSAEQFIGQPADAIFPPARGDLRAALELAASGSGASYEYPAYRYTYADTDGTSETAFCWSVRVEPVFLRDYRGRPEFEGVLVTLADVLDLADESDRLRRETDELQREVDRLRRVIEAAEAPWPLAPEPPSDLRLPEGGSASAGVNRLLRALPLEEERQLLATLERVSLPAHAVLYEPGAVVSHVYFPLDCVISLLTVTEEREAAEAATICREGVVGLPVLPGAERAFGRAVCQVPGEALRMEAEAFRAALGSSGAFAWLVQRFMQRLLEQVMQTAACNRLHRVEQRAARWLLQVRDCTSADEFLLTQEALAAVLSVQRPTVTQVAGMLRQAGAIEYHRGRMQVVDAAALEALACSCARVIGDRLV